MSLTDQYLFIGGGENQLQFIKTAILMGKRCIVVDGNRNAPGMAMADERHLINIDHTDSIIDALGDTQISFCVSEQTDSGMLSLAAINELKSLAGLKTQTALAIRDKFKQRQRCADHGIRQPEFCTVEDYYNSKLYRENNFKIAKPRVGQSSIGLKFLGSNPSRSDICALQSKNYLIEECISGKDISIDGFVDNGAVTCLVYAEKIKYLSNRFVDRELYCSSEAPKSVENAVSDIVCAFGLNNVFFHVEFKLYENNVWLIELTARGGGTGLSTIIPSLMYGVDTSVIRFELGSGVLKNSIGRIKQLPNLSAAMVFCTDEELAFYKSKLQDLPIVKFLYRKLARFANDSKISDGTARQNCLYVAYNEIDVNNIKGVFDESKFHVQ